MRVIPRLLGVVLQLVDLLWRQRAHPLFLDIILDVLRVPLVDHQRVDELVLLLLVDLDVVRADVAVRDEVVVEVGAHRDQGVEEQPDISFAEELVILCLVEDLPLQIVLMIVVEQMNPFDLRYCTEL